MSDPKQPDSSELSCPTCRSTLRTVSGEGWDHCPDLWHASAPEPEYNLEHARVLHCEHPIQADVDTPVAAIVPGFSWAEVGEGTGMFLCRCMKPCKDTEHCGLVFWDEREISSVSGAGHLVQLKLPWTDKVGEVVTFDLWCCNNCAVEGTGATFDTWVGRFYDVPARLLAYVHETRSHTYLGARKSLGKRYPDEFTEGTFVTLILYRRTT